MMCWDAPTTDCDGMPEMDVLIYELRVASELPLGCWVTVGETEELCAPNWITEPPRGKVYFGSVRARDRAGNTSDECGGDDG